ncbi:hypothetical protein JHK85_004478 [Glycine max]|nr:hypothetical protein JHK85_004478 [Glycine max]
MGSEGVPSMVVEVMLVAAVELTDASSWWHEIDDSLAWQDCISYTLVVLYGIVAAVALVQLAWIQLRVVFHLINILGLCTLFNFAVRYVVFIFYQNVQRLKLEAEIYYQASLICGAFASTWLAHVVSTNGLKPSFYTINIVVYVVQFSYFFLDLLDLDEEAGMIQKSTNQTDQNENAEEQANDESTNQTLMPDFMKPAHDQYAYRHANGLCVIGLAPSHIAFKDEGGITAIDFNVGKSDRNRIKVTGKQKKKPISLVLEKIRQRKLEILQK